MTGCVKFRDFFCWSDLYFRRVLPKWATVPDTSLGGVSAVASRYIVLGVLVAVCLYVGIGVFGGLTRTMGLHSVSGCPDVSISNRSEVEQLYESGLEALAVGRAGEYYLESSMDAGLPLVHRAAIHGHHEAMRTYRGFMERLGVVEMLPIAGLSSGDASVESLMWELVMIHLGVEQIPERERFRYAVLLDPERGFPADYFEDKTGIGWRFQMMSPWGIQWARDQAWAWRNCFDSAVSEPYRY